MRQKGEASTPITTEAVAFEAERHNLHHVFKRIILAFILRTDWVHEREEWST